MFDHDIFAFPIEDVLAFARTEQKTGRGGVTAK